MSEKQYVDREMTCVEGTKCLSSGSFLFTAGEQRFYDSQGFKDDPKRCKPCRQRRKAGQEAKAAPAPVAVRGEFWDGEDGGRRRGRR